MIGAVIGWTSLLIYLLAGCLVGRIVGRRAYIATRRDLCSEGDPPTEGLGWALGAFVLAFLFWPLFGAWLAATRLLGHAIPEYRTRVAKVRQREQENRSRELDLEIKRQQVEIARLAREIKEWDAG